MAEAPVPEREILTWDLFGTATRKLAQTIADDGYQADVVLAIARGGLTVAGALAYALGLKNCAGGRQRRRHGRAPAPRA